MPQQIVLPVKTISGEHQKKYWNYPKSKIPLLWLIRGVSTKVSDVQHQLTSTKFNKRGGENSFFGRELLRDKQWFLHDLDPGLT